MTDSVDEFVRESRDRIAELNNWLLKLERAPENEEATNEVFRTAHTLKGNCAALGFDRASDLAHAIEDLLDAVRAGDVAVTAELMDAAFAGVDELETMVEEAGAHGEIRTDPSPTIDAIRERIEGEKERPRSPSSTDDEIDAILERFSPTSNGREVYFARLGVGDGEETNDGARVVRALIDAFELIGTDPPKETIEADRHGDAIDAVFAARVDEGSIATALESVDAVGEFELVDVTERLEPEPEAGAETDRPDAGSDLSSEAAAELSVDELLGEFDEFDDLDERAREIGDVSAFEDMGDAGSFDDLFDGEVDPELEPMVPPEGGADDAVESAETVDTTRNDDADGSQETDDASDDDDTVDDASAVFEELKSEVETVEFDELRDELDELEFDEFDGEDEIGMDELLGDELETGEFDDQLDAEDGSLGDQREAEDDSLEDALEFDELEIDDPEDDRLEGEFDAEDDLLDDGPVDDELRADAGVEDDPTGDAGAEAQLEELVREDDVDPFDDPDSASGDEFESTTDEESTAGDDGGSDDAGSEVSDDVMFEFGGTVAEVSDGDERESRDVDDDEADSGSEDAAGDESDESTSLESADGAFDDESAGSDGFGAEAFDDESGDSDGFDDDSGGSDAFGAEAFGDESWSDEGFGTDAPSFDGSESGVGDDVEDWPDPDGSEGFETPGAEFDPAPAGGDGFADDASRDGDDAVPRTEPESDDGHDPDEIEIPDIDLPTREDRGGSSAESDRTTDETQSVRVDVDRIDDLLNLVEGLVTSRSRLRHAIEADADATTLEDEVDAIGDVTSELQETVMDIRLVPVKTVTSRLPRTVRDLARDQGKEASFETEGEDVELDRSVLDRIGDPLLHLVRNAVDHGIEPPEEREAAGKPREGAVELRAERTRNRITMTVADDGRGIDPDSLRSAAVEAGVLEAAEAEALPDEDAYDLAFHPGLSTREDVTDVSGRGVGMDVVKRTVDDLGGTVSIDSERGEGTTVTMTLPVTVAISDVLFVETGEEAFGIPTEVVGEVEAPTGGPDAGLDSDSERKPEDGDEEEVRVIDLEDALETPGSPDATDDDGEEVLVWIRDDVRPVALRCDGVGRRQEVVVRPFEGFMSGIPGVDGATVRGRGDVVTILDVETL